MIGIVCSIAIIGGIFSISLIQMETDSNLEGQPKNFDFQELGTPEVSLAQRIISNCEDDMHCTVNEIQRVAQGQKIL